MERTDITFSSRGRRCAAWLYRPEGDGPYPCVVMAHGFGAVKEARLDIYAERFAAAGLAALVFDYRNFGASEGEPRQLLDIGMQQEDWLAAIARARGLDKVDPERIALWGTSFSAGHAVALAAREPRIAAAVVAQVPFADGITVLTIDPPLDALRKTAAAVKDAWRGLRGGPPHRIKLVGPPGSVAVMTTEGADQGYRELFPRELHWDDTVCARILLQVGFYRPVKDAPRVQAPLLVIVGERDLVTPPGPARKLAEAAPRGELVELPIDHWQAYRAEWFERIVELETDFLRRHLEPAPRSDAVPAGDAAGHPGG